MIVDTLSNAHLYTQIHPRFEAAFAYLENQFGKQNEVGKVELDGKNLVAIYSCKPGISPEAAGEKFECHNHHIDIQFCTEGVEEIGWKHRQKCISPKGEYNPEKDVCFFHDSPDCYLKLTPGQFAIFFPNDVHAPMIGHGDIGKMVMKVKI